MNRNTLFALLQKRKAAYSQCFLDGDGNLTKAGAIVLNDIVDTLKPYASTQVVDKSGRVDPVASAAREGMRLSYLHIIKRLHLDDERVIQSTKALQEQEI